jgi:hypothetical protein
MADSESKRPMLGPHDVCVDNYRGVPVDPATGLPLDPFKTRDRRNARTNPAPGTHQADDPDAPWGMD